MEGLSFSNDTNYTSVFSPTSGGLKHQILIAVLGLCCVLGLLGNVVVLVVLLRKWDPTSFTQKLMLNLACCDLLSLAIIPVWMRSLRLVNLNQDLNKGTCKISSFLMFLSLYANILITMLMSVQRYVSVLHRQSWARLGRMGEMVLMLGLWGVASLLTWPSVAAWGWWVDGRFICGRPLHLDSQGLSALLTETLLGFVVPFSIITACYICLYKKVRQATISSNERMTELISRIIITFLVLWSPKHVVNVAGIMGILLHPSHPDLSYKLEYFRDVTEGVVQVLPIFSAVVDPFLYAFAFRKFLPVTRKTKKVDNRAEEPETLD